MITIPITGEEIAVIAAALRYQSNDMQSNILARHERARIADLLTLANHIEDRYLVATAEAARTETIGHDE